MFQNPNSSEPETSAERNQRHLRTCRRLAELGMMLLEASTQEAPGATPQDQATPQAEAAKSHAAHQKAAHFVRVSASVRQTIILERRIAGAQLKAAHPNRHRREALRPALHHAASQHPNAPALKRAIDVALDEALADPHSPDGLWDLHTELCRAFNLTPDYTTHPAAELLTYRPNGGPEPPG